MHPLHTKIKNTTKKIDMEPENEGFQNESPFFWDPCGTVNHGSFREGWFKTSGMSQHRLFEDQFTHGSRHFR